MDAVELHSGEYVERYNLKTMDRIEALAKRMGVRDTDKVADFGCGNGMLLRALGSRTGSYDGVDFSADMIASANERSKGLKNFEFHRQDIVSFCLDHPATFDVAATLDFSEHIDDAQFVEIYTAIGKSLKPTGKLFLHTPNLAFFMERLKAKGLLKQFPEHIAVRDAEQNTKLLKQCGFGSVKVERIAHYNILKVVYPLSRFSEMFAARLWITASI